LYVFIAARLVSEANVSQDMTITNYTGQARDLLKRMIEAMGGKVRGDMNKQTTHVIAAR
jgi:NAD-dependent DNA ligase